MSLRDSALFSAALTYFCNAVLLVIRCYDSFFDHFFHRFAKFAVPQFVKLETSCQCIGKRVDRFMYIMQWPHKSKSSIFIAINRVQVYQRSYRLVELSCENWKCTLRSSVYVRSV